MKILRNKIAFLAFLVISLMLVFSISSVLAQEMVTATAEVATEAVEPDVPINELLSKIGQVISDWRTLGLLAGLIVLISLGIMVLRVKKLNEYLESKNIKWLKTYIAAGLGGLLTALTTYQTGAGLSQSIIAGVIFGLASVGGHQAITKSNKPK